MTKNFFISAAALCALSTSASNFDGWHGGFNLGYSNLTAEGSSAFKEPHSKAVKKSDGAFSGGAFVGYNHMFCHSNWLLGAGGSFDYAGPKGAIATQLDYVGPEGAIAIQSEETSAVPQNLYYQPFLTTSVYGKVGYALSETLLSYAKLGVGATMDRYSFEVNGASGEGWSLVSAIGFQGVLEGKWSWHTELSYRAYLIMNPQGFLLEDGGQAQLFRKKPAVVSVHAGLTYKF